MNEAASVADNSSSYDSGQERVGDPPESSRILWPDIWKTAAFVGLVVVMATLSGIVYGRFFL